jgi:kynureninase
MINDMQIIPDFRPPDNIRIGITPLYTSFCEIHDAVMRTVQIMEQRLYEKYREMAPTVT